MTDAQLKHLQQLLIERRRRLVCCYTSIDGRLWAISRPCGCKNAHNDLQHELLLVGDSCLIRLTHYPDGVFGPD